MKKEDGEINREIVLSTLLRNLVNSSTASLTGCINLNNDVEKGLIKEGKYYIQVCRKITINGKNDHYELIIADKSAGNKKKMVVLIADGFESELVEMDSSGMRENVIIDLNFGGRRWEGEELNGKPFGFGCEYSEEDNLVYEGFVFEERKFVLVRNGMMMEITIV